jgi:hypothetical protein
MRTGVHTSGGRLVGLRTWLRLHFDSWRTKEARAKRKAWRDYEKAQRSALRWEKIKETLEAKARRG